MHQSWFGNNCISAEAPLMVVGDCAKNAVTHLESAKDGLPGGLDGYDRD